MKGQCDVCLSDMRVRTTSLIQAGLALYKCSEEVDVIAAHVAWRDQARRLISHVVVVRYHLQSDRIVALDEMKSKFERLCPAPLF